MTYNLSLVNGSAPLTLLNTINEQLLYGWLGNIILLMIVVITFLSFYMKTNEPRISFNASAIITAVAALFLRGFNLINDSVTYLTFVFAGITLLLLYISSK